MGKRLAGLYHLTLDDLIAFDAEVEEIQRTIDSISEETQKKVDWTKVWGKRYPVLTTYQQRVKISDYAGPLRELLDRLKREYGYSDVDACLGTARTEVKRWGKQQSRFPQNPCVFQSRASQGKSRSGRPKWP